MRQFIRHPSDIPIEFTPGNVIVHTKECLKNVSEGELCFFSRVAIDPGAAIHVRIPISRPAFEAQGIVVWCSRMDEGYEVGASFSDPQTEFQVRMVEQVCHIEHYKKEVLERDGRNLTGEEAATEWIEKYATDFPGQSSDCTCL